LVQAGEVLVAGVTEERGIYRVEVDTRLAVRPDWAWEVLTDYPRLGRVNEAIERSEVLERRGAEDYRVRTVTQACVYFFCKRIEQVQDVVQLADGRLLATVLPEYSDFRYGWARLYVWPEGDRTRVRVLAEVEPDFWIPPLIGPWLIKRKLRSEALETVLNLERLTMVAAP
jgi:hypothetical protein